MNRPRTLMAAACAAAVMSTGLLVAAPARAATIDWIDPAYRSYSGGAAVTDIDSAGRLLVHTPGEALVRLLPNGGVDDSYAGAVTPDQDFSGMRADGDRAVVVSRQDAAPIEVRRYTAAGPLDTGFGDAGVLTVPLTATVQANLDYTFRQDGSLLLAVATADSTSGPFTTTLRVYTPDGQPDATFGTGGVITVPQRLWDLEVDDQGRPVMATIDDESSESIRRFTVAGQPDPTFSGDGLLPIAGDLAVNGIRMEAGGITVAGHRYLNDGSLQSFAGRITGAGAWDGGFGSGGIVFAPSRACDPVGLDAQLVGSVVYLAGVNTCGDSPGYLTRFTSTGKVDTSFGTGGTLTFDAANNAYVTEVRMDPRPDGRLVLTLFTQRGPRDGTGTPGITTVMLADTPTAPTPGAFQPLTPTRVLDTRQGLGAPKRAVAANGTVGLQVTGRGGVPATAGAVVLNVTAVSATRACAVTVYPAGSPLPTASNLNCSPGRTTPNLVTVKVGPDGKVNLRNGSTGTTQLIADVAGYYQAGTATAAGAFVPLTPSRLLDTRRGTPVAANGTVDVPITGAAGIPAGASAVVLNLTAVAPRAAGVVTAYPSGTKTPAASNLNFPAGQTLANLATVKIGANGRVTLKNGSTGSTHLLADVAGYYLGGTPTKPGTFVALDPTRVLDSRTGVGVTKAPVRAGGTVRLSLAGKAGMPVTGIGAVVLNTTVTQPTGNGLITVWPEQDLFPVASNLNFTRGQTVANLVAVKSGPRGVVDLGVSGNGTVQVVADVAGYFLDPAPA